MRKSYGGSDIIFLNNNCYISLVDKFVTIWSMGFYVLEGKRGLFPGNDCKRLSEFQLKGSH